MAYTEHVMDCYEKSCTAESKLQRLAQNCIIQLLHSRGAFPPSEPLSCFSAIGRTCAACVHRVGQRVANSWHTFGCKTSESTWAHRQRSAPWARRRGQDSVLPSASGLSGVRRHTASAVVLLLCACNGPSGTDSAHQANVI